MTRLVRPLLLLLPVPMLVAAVTAWRDPAHLFDAGTYEAGVAQLLLRGRHVTGVADCDERLLQSRFAAGLTVPPQVLVLGSSRIMQVGKDLFPGESLFNAAVSGASIEDLVAIYELYRSRGLLPRRLVLGLDPWLLNRHHGQARWRTLAASYHAFTSRERLATPGGVAGADGWAPRVLEAVSPAYFQASLRSLLTQPLRRIPFRPTDDLEAEDAGGKRSDGSYVYARSFRSRSQLEIDGDAVSYARATPVYSLGSFAELDPEAERLLEALVRRVLADGVELTLVLAPYHPDTYRILMGSGRYEMVRAAETWFRRLAEGAHAHLVGSFDPVAAAIPAHLFFDGMHPREEAFRILLNGGAGSPGETAHAIGRGSR